MSLTKDQKEYIKNKVEQLGCIEKVVQFYNRDSVVCEYAHEYAKKLFSKKVLKRRAQYDTRTR